MDVGMGFRQDTNREIVVRDRWFFHSRSGGDGSHGASSDQFRQVQTGSMDVSRNRRHDRRGLQDFSPAGIKEWIMPHFLMLMIGGWTSAIAVIGFFALAESGKLLEIHRRTGFWLEKDSVSRASAQNERENLVRWATSE
jgi:hypothetical protein